MRSHLADIRLLTPNMHAKLVGRLVCAVCLAAAGAGQASAQCYLFTSSSTNTSLQIQINSFLSQIGPINTTGGGYSYTYTFFGNYTLTVGNSTQVTTNQLGGVSLGYSTVGEDLSTVVFLVAEPSLVNTWQVSLQSSQNLLPKGLPQVFPPISKWVLNVGGMHNDLITLPGKPAVFDPISGISSCNSTVGGGGGGGSPTPTISISNTDLQFTYTEDGATPTPQTIDITNANGGSLTWTAVASSSWIVLSETATALTVSIDPSGLPAGPNIGAIVITSPDATNSPQSITVTLTVAAPSPPVVSGPMHFVPMTPCRAVDTRNADGPLGGPSMSGQTSRSFAIPSSACGIPSNAGGYSLNVAVVPQKTLGYVTVWPTGQNQPLAATLTSLDGRIRSNAAIVAAGTNGAVSVFATDDTDVILDVNGYFDGTGASAAGASAFYPLTPCRIADTRNAAGPLGGPSLAAQSTRSFLIANSTCGVPADAQAYSLNFAAVPKGPLGYITAWPTGQPQPVVASLNAVTGTVTANAVIVPAGENGAVSVFTTNDTDLVIDIDGYFAAPGAGGLSLYAATPCRVLDSRNPQGTPPFNGVINVNVTASACGLPATAQAFVFNATVVPPGPFGYLTMWPEGETQPVVATLNALDGAITSNMAIVPTTNGSISVYGSNPTYLILDSFGYFAP